MPCYVFKEVSWSLFAQLAIIGEISMKCRPNMGYFLWQLVSYDIPWCPHILFQQVVKLVPQYMEAWYAHLRIENRYNKFCDIVVQKCIFMLIMSILILTGCRHWIHWWFMLAFTGSGFSGRLLLFMFITWRSWIVYFIFANEKSEINSNI